MIRIEMLPADRGDCLLVEYGTETRIEGRLLVDGGIKGTYRNALKPRLARIGKPCPMDLMVITHIDQDHLEGILALLDEKDPERIAKPQWVWFNGYAEVAAGRLGAAQAEDVSRRLMDLPFDWNAECAKHVVVVPRAGALPRVTLPQSLLPGDQATGAGRATLTLLSPGPAELGALLPVWEEALRDAGLKPGGGRLSAAAHAGTLGRKKKPRTHVEASEVATLAGTVTAVDDGAPNGSSIAFILEHRGKKVLFGGDAHPDVLEKALVRYGGGGKVKLDAYKMSHHGSARSNSRALLARMECRDFLVSTNGNQFGHPDAEAIARVIVTQKAPRVHFNCRSDYNKAWANPALQQGRKYTAFYPEGEDGLVVEVG